MLFMRYLVKEAHFLWTNGHLSADLYQRYAPFILPLPLLVCALSPILSRDWMLGVFFVLVDLVTNWCLYEVAHSLRIDEREEEQAVKRAFTPEEIALCHLYNPYSALTTAGQNLASLNGTLLLLAVLAGMKGRAVLAGAFSALCVYLDPMSCGYLISVWMLLRRPLQRQRFSASVIAGISILFGASTLAVGARPPSVRLIFSFYRDRLMFSDARPNVGVWWYLFALIFHQFRTLLAVTVNLVQVGLWLPVSLKYAHVDALFAVFVGSIIQTAFKGYPTAADWALTLSLLSLQSHILRQCRLAIFLPLLIAQPVVTVISGRVWAYWIQYNGFNSNFFYVLTLVGVGVWVLLALESVSAWGRMRILQLNPKLKEPLENNTIKLFQR